MYHCATRMNRRSFVAAAAATLAASRWSMGQRTSESAKLARLSLMTLPWDPFLKVPGYNQQSDHSLDIVDVPDMFADRYGIHSIELQYQHVPIAQIYRRLMLGFSHITHSLHPLFCENAKKTEF